MIVKLTDSNIDQCLKNNLKRFILVDFWTSCYEICRFNSAVADEISKAYEDVLDIGKVNVDENPYIVARYQIKLVPCMALFKEQKIVDKLYGIVVESSIMKNLHL